MRGGATEGDGGGSGVGQTQTNTWHGRRRRTTRTKEMEEEKEEEDEGAFLPSFPPSDVCIVERREGGYKFTELGIHSSVSRQVERENTAEEREGMACDSQDPAAKNIGRLRERQGPQGGGRDVEMKAKAEKRI